MVADYLKIKLRDGWLRIVKEHPGIDFSISMPAVNAAWARLDSEYMRWAAGQNRVADVLRAFREWEREIVNANSATTQMSG